MKRALEFAILILDILLKYGGKINYLNNVYFKNR